MIKEINELCDKAQKYTDLIRKDSKTNGEAIIIAHLTLDILIGCQNTNIILNELEENTKEKKGGLMPNGRTKRTN